MTTNGKILLGVTLIFGAISIGTATLGGSDTFFQIWMAAISISTGIVTGVCGSLCLGDTLLENEE